MNSKQIFQRNMLRVVLLVAGLSSAPGVLANETMNDSNLLANVKSVLTGKRQIKHDAYGTELLEFLRRSDLVSTNRGVAIKALDHFYAGGDVVTNVAEYRESMENRRLFLDAYLSGLSAAEGKTADFALGTYAVSLQCASLNRAIQSLPKVKDAHLNYNPSPDSDSPVLDPKARPEEFKKWQENENRLKAISFRGRLETTAAIETRRAVKFLNRTGLEADAKSKLQELWKQGRSLSEVRDEIKRLAGLGQVAEPDLKQTR
jgi:hypothetical protein